MPVAKDLSGRRSVQAEVEVPGTPGTVWAAVATGPGISSWFVPAEVDGRVGGQTVCHFGPGNSMDSVATITEWQPPRRFAAGTEEGPNPILTQWIVEPQPGGRTCIVRVVHSWSADTDDLDAQFEGHAAGWASFFKILRFHLTHFPGEESTIVQLAALSRDTVAAAFERLMGPLGVRHGAEGRIVSSEPPAPPVAGEVLEARNAPEGFSVMLRLDQPAGGIAHMIGFPMSGPVHVSVRFYLHGVDAAAARTVEAAWRAWLERRFPQT